MKLVYLAAAMAATTLVALPAAAADLRVSSAPSPTVRINVVGKSDSQVASEIQSAAGTVCANAGGSCIEAAVRDANRQYAAIKRSREATNTRLEVVRGDRASVHVPVAGRTLAQIDADIDHAARTVCRAIGAGDYQSCVTRAAKDARAQLREMAVAPAAEQVASR